MTGDKLINMFGLSVRARKAVSGALPVDRAIQTREAKVVLIDAQAAPGTREKYESACGAAGIPLVEIEEGALERLLGSYRVIAAVTDESFATQIIKLSK